MENNENLIPEEEESNLLSLTDENGQETVFEHLDVIEYQGKEYLILLLVVDEDGQVASLWTRKPRTTCPWVTRLC